MNTAAVTSQESRDQFLHLLVTQLRHQDPIEPVKQENFLQQLAQFSTLEGIENLNVRFDDMLRLQQFTQGASLIGASVSYNIEEDQTHQQGRVESLNLENGRLALLVEGRSVPLEALRSVFA
ncbi:MAG: flagellar hook capping protein [Planctomycetaceae bacterium]|nr:MAG: flagellar hook capping protein [Planctomycetaceae bacterium]